MQVRKAGASDALKEDAALVKNDKKTAYCVVEVRQTGKKTE